MKRAGQPAISQAGIEALNQYKMYLQQSEDMSPVTIRNYLTGFQPNEEESASRLQGSKVIN